MVFQKISFMPKLKAWIWNIHSCFALVVPELVWTRRHQQTSNPLTSRITDGYSGFMDHEVPEFEERQLKLIVYIFLDACKTLTVSELPSGDGSSAVRMLHVTAVQVCLFDCCLCRERLL